MVRLGQRLKEERLSKGFTIEEVAKATKIRPQFITAIEQSNYKQLPSKAYAHGFVKNYISFLELPLRESLAMFRREFDEKEYLDVLPESFTKKKEIPLQKMNWQRTVLIFVIVGICLICFLFFQYRAAIFNPSLTIASPKEGSNINSNTITVTGTTDSNATVTVNNQSSYVDGDGHFRKDISLFSGANIITVVSTNKFGKSSKVLVHIKVTL